MIVVNYRRGTESKGARELNPGSLFLVCCAPTRCPGRVEFGHNGCDEPSLGRAAVVQLDGVNQSSKKQSLPHELHELERISGERRSASTAIR